MIKNLPFYLLGLVSLFILVLVFSFTYQDSKKYVLSETENQLLEKLINKEQFIQPHELANILLTKKEGYILVDLRNQLIFRKGQIEGAINIPFQQIMDTKWEAFFSDSTVLKILYCHLNTYANQTWMLLDQLGYRNIKVLEGGYSFWKENVDNINNVKSDGAYDEIPVYDFKEEMIKAGDGSAPAIQENTPAVQINIKKKDGPKGGCG